MSKLQDNAGVRASSRQAYAWIAALWISCLIVGSLLPFEAKG
jgi:hypothetical protein